MKNSLYQENERLVMLKHLNVFNLNPFAFWEMLKNYIEKVHPNTFRIKWQPKDESEYAELTIRAVGNNNPKVVHDVELVDRTFLGLFMLSYFKGMRPLPISFQVMDAIEIHIESEAYLGKDKNPLRNIKPWIKI